MLQLTLADFGVDIVHAQSGLSDRCATAGQITARRVVSKILITWACLRFTEISLSTLLKESA